MKSLPINNDTYQVYFFTCSAHRPFRFAIHPWIVIVDNGKITRWEIIHRKYQDKKRFGYVYKNFYNNPIQGLKKHHFSSEYWYSTLIDSVSGDDKSLAFRIVNFVEEMTPFYPHQENYVLFPGPNSNTYIAWILQKFPELKIKLPWNAFGKNYK